MRMQNSSREPNLRGSVSGKGKTLAVVRLSDCEAIQIEPGISVMRGLWDGEAALALVAAEEASPSRLAHESELKILHNIFFELSLCESEDEVCRQAVAFGHGKLGFERLAIWLIDRHDPRWRIGTWRIDESGELRGEQGARFPRKMGDPCPLSGEGYLLRDDGAAARGRMTAPLWDGQSLLGEMDMDCLAAHVDRDRQESFLIFARIVAQLLSLKRAERELKQLASTDFLTGTVNRRTALVILEKHIGQCLRSGSPLTLCLADLDGLKAVNDAYGHAAGDEYICRASAALVRGVRVSDTVSRIGGDEFLLIFPECGREIATAILDRVNAEMAESSVAEGYLPRLSWGIAFLEELDGGFGPEGPDPQRCIDRLLELADQRMYEDKRRKGHARAAGRMGAGRALMSGRARGDAMPESQACRPRGSS